MRAKFKNSNFSSFTIAANSFDTFMFTKEEEEIEIVSAFLLFIIG